MSCLAINKALSQSVEDLTVKRHTARSPCDASALALLTSISAGRRADQLEEDLGVLLHALEELKGFAACAVSGDRNVGGGMHSLIPAYGLAAQEVASPLVRSAINRYGRVTLRTRCGPWRGHAARRPSSHRASVDPARGNRRRRMRSSRTAASPGAWRSCRAPRSCCRTRTGRAACRARPLPSTPSTNQHRRTRPS